VEEAAKETEDVEAEAEAEADVVKQTTAKTTMVETSNELSMAVGDEETQAEQTTISDKTSNEIVVPEGVAESEKQVQETEEQSEATSPTLQS